MSVQYCGKAKLPDLPVNLRKFIKTTNARKWKWLAEFLCMRPIDDISMFPAPIPWCELVGFTYEDWDGDGYQ